MADAEFNTYKTITVELDFTQADANTNLNNHDSFQTTTEADVNGISIYFFNNLSNASSAYTTYVRNIKLEKIQWGKMGIYCVFYFSSVSSADEKSDNT